jgi:hypothetical protein
MAWLKLKWKMLLKMQKDTVQTVDLHDGEAAKCKTPASSDAQAMNKSEKGIASLKKLSLIKSELEAAKAKSEEDKKNLEAVCKAFLKKFVEKTAPAGKAITSLDIIAKTESAGMKSLFPRVKLMLS